MRKIADDVLAPIFHKRVLSDRFKLLSSIGGKSCGLLLLPPSWTPPYVVIPTALYDDWSNAAGLGLEARIEELCRFLASYCESSWGERWTRGLVLRSSATVETLNERGAYDSVELTADFGTADLRRGILRIFEEFKEKRSDGSMAIIVQARCGTLLAGHCSNERRVSKTVNQWMWERHSQQELSGRFNSQRSSSPRENEQMLVGGTSQRAYLAALKRLARWCTELGGGRTHLEWGFDGQAIWLFQIDFEDDAPNVGVNPNEFLRPVAQAAALVLHSASPFNEFAIGQITGWSKLDKIALFTKGIAHQFPKLYYITGDQYAQAKSRGYDLSKDIQLFSLGRAVCRTDTTSPHVPRLNLPRTDSVTSNGAVAFIESTLADLLQLGANPAEVCFILHKFIPAKSAAWVRAQPDSQIVLVDTLWGIPDGLQYLSHDTFEYDIKRNEVSAEHIRFKPMFLQERENGAWELIRVQRDFVRSRSLSGPNVEQIARHTFEVSVEQCKPIQIMWFCDLDAAAGAGNNVPWFMMDADVQVPALQAGRASPVMRRFVVRNRRDLAEAAGLSLASHVILLEPDIDLFRDNEFLEAVANVAKEAQLPVELRGSILGHAYYTLERSGVVVVTSRQIRARSRQKREFRKLVRDYIPSKIVEHGEKAAVARIAKSESRLALIVKLFEEAQELSRAQGPREVAEEIADLLEVVQSLASVTGIEWSTVMELAEKKRAARGGFQENVVLLETSWPSWVEQARKQPELTVALRELGQVQKMSNDRYVLSFPSVLVEGADNRVRLDARTEIAIRITGDGVEVALVDATTAREKAQLKFSF